MPKSEPSGCLLAIFKLFGGAPAPQSKTGAGTATAPLPYRRKDYLLSKAERSFFGVLQHAVGQQYLIFAKVRVADLVWLPKGTEKRQSHFNRIQSKHIDFVLCDPDVVRPVLAIELDDASHGRAARQSRDAFVDEALRTAGLPLLRVPCQQAYNVAELAASIQSSASSY